MKQCRCVKICICDLAMALAIVTKIGITVTALHDCQNVL